MVLLVPSKYVSRSFGGPSSPVGSWDAFVIDGVPGDLLPTPDRSLVSPMHGGVTITTAT